MTILWPSALVHALARRRAVILIGSGVSANAVSATGEHPPTWGAFLHDAYSALGRRVPHIAKALKNQHYLEACDFLKSEHNASWDDLLRTKFLTPHYKPADIHKAIFDIDTRIVVSLNFDRIYETYAIQASENTVVVKNYYDGDVRQAVVGNDRYIIKPHGSADAISRIIFTLEDYARARTQHASFYEVLTALLHSHTFLCIGCGLSDPDIQYIFEDYRYKHSESPHYITLPQPISSAEQDLIRKTRGLNTLQYSSRNNHDELTTSLVLLSKEMAARRDELAISQNW